MPGGRDITLFSGYEQKENRTTNYAILLLRMLYLESPSFLDEALAELTAGHTEGRVGVQFRQQERRASSVPDAVIFQEPLTLFVETKNTDWFTDDQLERHLGELSAEPGLKVLIALANFDGLAADRFDAVQATCAERYGDAIAFAPVTFAQFVRAVRRPGLPKRLADAVDEFESYLDEADLLPRWPARLDVCNCGRSFWEQSELGVYVCPATGGHYSHQKSRYFGAYKDKAVRLVGEIEAVVDVRPDGSAAFYHANAQLAPEAAFERARGLLASSGRDPEIAWRVFLLGPLHETHFAKGTPGGMMGSKQYFDVGALAADGAANLAAELDGLTWAQIQ